MTKLPLDHPERVFNLGTHLGFGFLNLASGFVERIVLAQLLIRAPAHRNLPDDFASFMLKSLLDAGVPSIGSNHVFLAVQQFVDLAQSQWTPR